VQGAAVVVNTGAPSPWLLSLPKISSSSTNRGDATQQTHSTRQGQQPLATTAAASDSAQTTGVSEAGRGWEAGWARDPWCMLPLVPRQLLEGGGDGLPLSGKLQGVLAYQPHPRMCAWQQAASRTPADVLRLAHPRVKSLLLTHVFVLLPLAAGSLYALPSVICPGRHYATLVHSSACRVSCCLDCCVLQRRCFTLRHSAGRVCTGLDAVTCCMTSCFELRATLTIRGHTAATVYTALTLYGYTHKLPWPYPVYLHTRTA
jgi:hypothetical protein